MFYSLPLARQPLPILLLLSNHHLDSLALAKRDGSPDTVHFSPAPLGKLCKFAEIPMSTHAELQGGGDAESCWDIGFGTVKGKGKEEIQNTQINHKTQRQSKPQSDFERCFSTLPKTAGFCPWGPNKWVLFTPPPAENVCVLAKPFAD